MLYVMSSTTKRSRQPEAVRKNLLDATSQVLIERGFEGMSLDMIVQRAGVSKGALFHHYPNKQGLVEALMWQLLHEFDSQVAHFMERDKEPRGRFLRAYIKTTLASHDSTETSKLLGAFALAMTHNAPLADVWQNWVHEQMVKHKEEFRTTAGSIIRYAIDGIWMEDCTGATVVSRKQRKTIVDELIQRTYDL